ncbi:DUF2177 family protein [Roseateles sp. DAIF2]|uniref:DUF2177 family protein n=1 Tax=Roseateles sp. DAIF2 TaxID=2714952 RepID=UPI0018A259A9|nr:DUF2177 family protein [Roseateles sp. DAIF2]QPF74511.1 DUF2177 family protein [Roseateles sp. DAIF2]
MTTSPRRLLLAYAAALLCFLLLDAAWLTWMGPRLYRPALAALMAPAVDWRAVALFYPLYLLGLLVFAIVPALERRRPGQALGRGALLGLVAYATYDLTNQATLRDWPWLITAIDLAWGSLLSGCTAWVSTSLTSRPARRTGAR